MENDLTEIVDAFSSLEKIASWQVVGVLVAAGTLSMAILDVFKNFTPIRRWFQTGWIGRWIDKRAQQFNGELSALPSKPIAPIETDQTIAQLVELSTGSEHRAFYDLPSEQLVAQMNAAAQVAFDYPSRYASVLAALSQGADIKDVLLTLGASTANLPPGAPEPAADPAGDASLQQEIANARNRVGNRIQRNLDGAQIALGNRWQLYMQLSAIVIAIVLLETSVLASSSGDLGAAVLAIPIGIAGGYFAPVARDLVVALQKLRAP